MKLVEYVGTRRNLEKIRKPYILNTVMLDACEAD